MTGQPCRHDGGTVYDARFASLRCKLCGHRVRLDGTPVRQTRTYPPWKWPAELAGRSRAKRGLGSR